jgi:hypothetical protein
MMKMKSFVFLYNILIDLETKILHYKPHYLSQLLWHFKEQILICLRNHDFQNYIGLNTVF